MKKKIMRSIYLSCFGIALALALVVYQLLTPQSMFTGIAILLANITILLSNVSKYKKHIQDMSA